LADRVAAGDSYPMENAEPANDGLSSGVNHECFKTTDRANLL
jgi:hypothetical protein